MTPVVELSGVAKHYRTPAGVLEVLNDVDLTIRAGEFIMLTGPSGSGKSTLLHLAALLDTPTRGRILIEGSEVGFEDDIQRAELRKNRIGMVFQKFCLLPHRSAIDNVLFRYRYIAKPPLDLHDRARALLARFGLERVALTPARLLSGGEMQRVAIARAILHPPGILVSDEPTGNLDAASAAGVMECFHQLNRDGLTILMVTHNHELLRYASRHLRCEHGRVREDSHAS